ncbi:MAG: PIN domain-containing protein [Micrococcales bacterium]|nr:PIN domain-containing protein [Micrococcales bacterium]
MTDLLWAVDSSAAIPLLYRHHPAHDAVRRLVGLRALHLTAHSLVETYSVLTRLSYGPHITPAEAVELIDDRFAGCLALSQERALEVHRLLAELGVAGGASYDALVGLAARDSGAVLLTRDKRAVGTYQAVGAEIELLAVA